MNEGDELLLLERDMGDGWTRVRHRISNAEGFVPTSYLVNFRQKYKKCYRNWVGDFQLSLYSRHFLEFLFFNLIAIKSKNI